MATTMKLIGKQTLGSNATSVTFSSIPSSYTDLLLAFSARTNQTGTTNTEIKVRFNGASADTNHSGRWLYGSGTTTVSGTDTFARAGYAAADGATASTFGVTEIVLPNYAGSTNKSFSASSAHETNSTTANIILTAGLWASTSAITSLELLMVTGSHSFVSGSSFYLYGITKE